MFHEFTAETQPLSILRKWWIEAQKLPLQEPTAMVLATTDGFGQASTRAVLLKDITDEGLIFYSNYRSRKGLEIASQPKVAANIHWDPIRHQVCVQGIAETISQEQSQAYWESRSRESQISQHISRQSEPLNSRDELRQLHEKLDKEHQGQPIPKPRHWGGYLIRPHHIEFWVNQSNRLHDRYLYRKVQNIWQLIRLFP